ncbi:hypothetical protein [Ottowia sp.]|uniref:hypothetical protein n=1 Tax=Ottowia sp. TaxID=1898956 RepID=UPI0025FA038F|nr:hypothetical protein [Ottowia sp.]
MLPDDTMYTMDALRYCLQATDNLRYCQPPALFTPRWTSAWSGFPMPAAWA